MTNMNATVMRVTPSPMMVEHAERTRWAHSLCRTDVQPIQGEHHGLSTRRVSGTGRDAGQEAQGARQVPLSVHRGHRRRHPRRPGRADVPRVRQVPEAPRRRVHQTHQDDDRPGHLLHHRAGHRFDRQGGHGRQGRRPGAGLLHGDVHLRAGHRPRGRQPDPPGRGPQARPLRSEQEGRHGQHGRLPAGHHPGRHPGPADPARRAAGRLRPPADGRRRAPRSSRPSATARPSSSASWS